MQVTLTKEFVYNGIMAQELPLAKPRQVTLVGVPIPTDPGIVTIRDGEQQRHVPTFVLEGCPRIDFGKLMNEEQLAQREKTGLLLGNGVGGFTGIVPIEQVPLLQ